MAKHPSAEKRHRQSLKRRTRNRTARSAMRSAVKSVLALAGEGKSEEAKGAARQATKLIDKAAVHGIIHKNNAARKISRLQRRLNAAATGS